MQITSSRISVYEVVVDLRQWDEQLSCDVPGFAESLIRLMPTTKKHKCMSGQEGGFHAELTKGTNFGHVIEHVLLELIRLSNPDAGEFTGWTRSRGNGEYVIHYGAPDFLTGRLAAVFGLEIVQQLQRGSFPDLDSYLMCLQNPVEYFSREGRGGGTFPVSGNSQLIQEMELADSVRSEEPVPVLSDWQRQSLMNLMGQVCSRFPELKERWQQAFVAFGGEFARGILDKVEIINPDCFSRQMLAGNLDTYFQGVANLSHMLRSLGIPIHFVTHSVWLYKNLLLLAVLEILDKDEEGRMAAVGDLDDFYMNVLQSIRDGFARTDLIPVRVDQMKLCGFQARNINRGTVLVVDDDAMARQVARDILEYNGIATIAARDGIEALGIMAENRSAVGVVLLDLVLPGMDGRAVCRRIMDGYPKTRVILSSGYPMENQDDLCLKEHEVCVLHKPYRSKALLTMVRDLLDLQVATAAVPP
ncbi:MAG: response regulator [Gemmatimonadales bacterium]|nr:response regulator [Gemmatimonadales bacterium]